MVKLYRRLRYGRPVVVVSGLPRSGTSMAMQMLAAGGLEVVTDGVREPSEDNPRGYFEDQRVRELHKNEQDLRWIGDSRGKAVKVISFLLKHLPKDNNYKVLFMCRDLSEVLASQRKMLQRRGEPTDTSDEEMLQLWRDHLWKVSYFLRHARHFEFIDIGYGDTVESPLQQAERIRDFLGHPMSVERMAAVVNESLYRNRAQ